MRLDLGRPGKHCSSVRLQGHDNGGCKHWVELSIVTIIGASAGPTLLIIGGTHGDEYEGQLIASELANQIDASTLKGRLILLPILNVPASVACQRHSPLDGRDLNRTYPGRPDGTISEVLAHFVINTLLPHADFVIDLHSGGTLSQYVPCAMMMCSGSRDLNIAMLAAVKNFGAPYGIIFRNTSSPGSMETEGTLEDAAHRRGIRAISTELGGGGYVTSDSLAVGRRGIRHLMAFVGLTDQHVHNKSNCRLMECMDASQYLISPSDGLWEPLVQLGDQVEVGKPVCRLFRADELMSAPQILRSQSVGVVVTKRVPARCRRGDFLVITAREFSK
jgi:predicted deacylase